MDKDSNVRVIDRLFDILELLAHAQQPMTLTDLVRASEMSKTTVFRLLQSMCDRGYVQKRKDGRYSLGPKFIELASYHINHLELQTEAKPFLAALYSELNLTVHLGTLDGDEIIYIEKMDLYPTQKSRSKVGYKTPAYCSSIGKCLMACLPGDELDEILYSCKFQKFTDTTIVNLYDFKNHLREVRKQGWAMDNGEHIPDHRCIGAPIYDYCGTAIASIGVSGSTDQITDEKIPMLVREVKEAARQISICMGYNG
ncbi:MAG: IclR family transcriptional regulator [bacterium]|nr:IclR family transcriptional regulator [bacterium]